MDYPGLTVAWLTPVLGIEGRLLYWEPLLTTFSQQFSNFSVFTSEFEGDTSKLEFEVIQCGSFKRLYKNERYAADGQASYVGGFSIASPVIFKALRKYEADLIIVNEFSLVSLYGILVRLCRPSTRVLLIVECRPRTAGSRTLNTVRKLFRRLIAKHADAVLTNNVDGERYLTDSLRVPDSKIIAEPYLVSIPHSIDTARDKGNKERAVKQFRGKPIRFLFVGQLIGRKGLQFALEAFARVLEEHGGQFQFSIVGDGPYRDHLVSQAKKMRLENHVIFHGSQPYSELTHFYSASDILLFPTLADYRSLVPFEAMSYGMPIVASIHDGGISETVSEGNNGFSFDPNNVEYLSKLIVRFIQHPDLIHRFSKESLAMSSVYTLDHAVATLNLAVNKAIDQ